MKNKTTAIQLIPDKEHRHAYRELKNFSKDWDLKD